MINLLIEGFQSTALPCTLALMVPGLVALLASRRSGGWAMTAYIVVTGFVAWARFSGYGPAELTGLGLVGAAALVLAGGVLAWSAETPREPWRAATSGSMIGAVAAWSWQPCVGRHLGDVLTDLGRSPGANLIPMMIYVLGTSLLLIVIAVLPIAVPALASARDAAAARHGGLGLGVVLALLLAVGVYDDVVAQLLRISSW